MKAARITLVEDNPADVLLVELAMKESGIVYELTRFSSGEEALTVLCPPKDAAGTDAPDLILLDLNTPGSDGFRVLGRLRQDPRLAHTPVAVISSSGAGSDIRRSTLQGVRYIQKPAHLAEFLATVGTAVKELLQR